MSTEGLSGFILLTLLTCAWVISPLLRSPSRRTGAFIEKQRARAIAYYERVLVNIRDLDEDHSTGKISTAEYDAERERWVTRGVTALKLLDELAAQQNIIDDMDADDASIDRAIEQRLQNIPDPT